jgi:hypothetical protein
VSRRRGALVLAVAIVAVLGVVAAVGGAFLAPPPQSETGVVIAVDGSSLTDVRGFTLRTTDGRTVEFGLGALENGAQFPPAHLREHQATATPIVVTYREEGSRRLAIRLEDAVASGATPGASPAASPASSPPG